ncbi:DinB family protein [Haloechinothrix sp. LS1_15]|uniref:DinB family protein n=1 Tax=Haloechinothrix sp. LS1_15 TaxID=2652248 RepID=UPI002944275E|nr:DinB family protein [Haloechinothrix sp. LS1_15]MDV6011108.1 DinB family protein [Haloechinothrix sp. LS1_15]
MTQPRPTHSIGDVATAGERATLDAFLDDYRDTVVGKLAGASEQDARRSLVPSATNLGGIVKHLRWVEYGWFHQLVGAQAGTNVRDHDRATEFRLDENETVASVIADYRATCAASRTAVAEYALDDTVEHHEFGRVSIRWIYVHLIEETARHAGQMDILREQIDGSTG